MQAPGPTTAVFARWIAKADGQFVRWNFAMDATHAGYTFFGIALAFERAALRSFHILTMAQRSFRSTDIQTDGIQTVYSACDFVTGHYGANARRGTCHDQVSGPQMIEL